MKTLLSAKQLTIRYFSIIAIAITAVHYSVFELTTDDLEYAFVENRLNNLHEFIRSKIETNSLNEFEDLERLTQEKNEFDGSASIVFDFQQLPDIFPDINNLPYNDIVEVEDESTLQAYYIMKVNADTRDVLLVINNKLYELSEENLLFTHAKQIAITLILTFVSLLVVIHVSKQLTLPIAIFSKALSSKNPADLNILSLPKKAQTKELEDMVNTFNRYQSHIQTLIERERSFNRYASHELRSPLMVMKGAITLLGESNDEAFTERQRQRLDKATDEMSEFVETLLSLTKPMNTDEKVEIEVDNTLINKIVENQVHLLNNKSVSWRIELNEIPRVRMPEAAFHILLGNLIKNAFAYTDEGHVIIEVSLQQLRVIDTGKGLESQSETIDGYGLGLLLVRDISRRFGYDFELTANKNKGTVATVHFAVKKYTLATTNNI